MSSRGKPKTTMAKLTREAKLRERRVEKAARKDARQRQAAEPPSPYDPLLGEDDQFEGSEQFEEEGVALPAGSNAAPEAS